MSRRPRSELPDGIYHVVNRGVGHSDIYRDDVDRKTFLTLLGAAVRRCGWTCHAYCLMTTHYHLILETERARLSAGMRALNGRYAQLFNERHDRRGHLFGGRYTVYLVEDDERLEASCCYVLENPVRAGLCESVSDWPWSGRPSLETASGTVP